MNNLRKIIEFLQLVIKSGLVFIILFYPIGIVHEVGHYLIGYSSGSQCIFDLVLKVTCNPLPRQAWLYFSMGGIFGIIASSALFVIKKLRSSNWIFIGVITTVFDQLVKALFETLIHSAYLNSSVIFWYMSSRDLIFLLILVLYYQKRNTRLASV